MKWREVLKHVVSLFVLVCLLILAAGSFGNGGDKAKSSPKSTQPKLSEQALALKTVAEQDKQRLEDIIKDGLHVSRALKFPSFSQFKMPSLQKLTEVSCTKNLQVG
ncbi:MAG TPA: hypothetical protein ENH24_05105 [Nitrospirae bacterium]|nr:hypothetical protein [Nitrospirota bacterium]